MPRSTRTTLILQIFRALPAGEPLTVADLVEGLLRYGHDFGPTASGHDDYAALTERALSHLVDRCELVEGVDPAGDGTWSRPSQLLPEPPRPVPRRAGPARTALPPPRQQVPAVYVVAASFCVALAVLAVLVPLIWIFLNP